jgi:hypothetical protein
MNTCAQFAITMAKQKGMTYSQAQKKFPRGPYKNSVYKNASETHEAHCVHCARAEVMAGMR